MGFKIEMNKAYNKIKWELILQVLSSLRFLTQFCHHIK